MSLVLTPKIYLPKKPTKFLLSALVLSNHPIIEGKGSNEVELNAIDKQDLLLNIYQQVNQLIEVLSVMKINTSTITVIIPLHTVW